MAAARIFTTATAGLQHDMVLEASRVARRDEAAVYSACRRVCADDGDAGVDVGERHRKNKQASPEKRRVLGYWTSSPAARGGPVSSMGSHPNQRLPATHQPARDRLESLAR